ncbi:MAG: ABC transporter substrate-binding protein [Devosia sp.]
MDRRGFIAAAGASLALAGVGYAQDADWAAIEQAARQEGGLVFYASFLGAQFQLDIMNTFTETYGIPVTLLDVRATELSERIRTEYATNRVAGDVYWSGFSVLSMIEAGMIAKIGTLPNAANIGEDLQPLVSEYLVPTHAGFYGIMVNTNLVSEADEPKSWADLLDPRWKDKILSDDMRAQGGGLNMFSGLYKALGREFHEKLALQNPVFSRDIGNDERRVARGEFPLRVPQLYANMRALEGLPVKFIMPTEGAPYTQGLMVALEGSPHPNAAKLFINHYLGERVQGMLAENGIRPAVAGLADALTSETARTAASVKLLGTTTPDIMAEVLAVSAEVYK